MPLAPGATGALAWGDYDRDGDLDLFLGKQDGGVVRGELYANNSNATSNAYLHLELVGTLSNRSGIGATVEVAAVQTAYGVQFTNTQIRQIEAGPGYSSHNSLTAEFGLGNATSVATVKINWPSGITQEITGLAINATHPVIEPTNGISISASVVTWPQSNFFATCPKGDEAAYVVTVDFPDNFTRRTISATELTLGVPALQDPIGFYADNPNNPGVPTTGEGPATSANNYVMTLRKTRIGGCGTGSVPVYMNGTLIGSAPISTKSQDYHLSSPGFVDAADLARFYPSMGTCPGIAGYDVCSDYNIPLGPSYVCISHSDLAYFVTHLGHAYSTVSKPGGAVANAELRLDTTGLGPDRAAVSVHLQRGEKVRTLGIVLRPGPSALEFQEWHGNPSLQDRVYMLSGVDEEGPRLVLVLLSPVPLNSEESWLGELWFRAMKESVTPQDIRISYEDYFTGDGEGTTAAADEPMGPQSTQAPRTELVQNVPNPFNPATHIRYVLAGATHVRLSVYDVTGKLVRVLVDEAQTPGTHEAFWDGRNREGLNVASGIYIYQLKADGVNQTKRMVLIR